jgi:hypothetical protein
VSEDPVKDGVNWYVYCGNNPLGFIDPTGLVYVPNDMSGATDEQKIDYSMYLFKQHIQTLYSIEADKYPGTKPIMNPIKFDGDLFTYIDNVNVFGNVAGDGLLAGAASVWNFAAYAANQPFQLLDNTDKLITKLDDQIPDSWSLSGGGLKQDLFVLWLYIGFNPLETGMAVTSAKHYMTKLKADVVSWRHGSNDATGVSGANNINAGSTLNSKLSAIETAQQNAAQVRVLPDGRIRYYTAEVSATKIGPTRGASYVTEWDPKTNTVRSWMESYNQTGDVIRVHPKMINGQAVTSQHYPPTAAEVGQ